MVYGIVYPHYWKKGAVWNIWNWLQAENGQFCWNHPAVLGFISSSKAPLRRMERVPWAGHTPGPGAGGSDSYGFTKDFGDSVTQSEGNQKTALTAHFGSWDLHQSGSFGPLPKGCHGGQTAAPPNLPILGLGQFTAGSCYSWPWSCSPCIGGPTAIGSSLCIFLTSRASATEVTEMNGHIIPSAIWYLQWVWTRRRCIIENTMHQPFGVKKRLPQNSDSSAEHV